MNKAMLPMTSIAAAAAACAAPPATLSQGEPAAAQTSSPTPIRTGDLHDFDWIAGNWAVSNRRLKVRGVGSDEWDEFPATASATIYLGGVANVDEIRFPTKGWSGITVRTFDIEKKQWSLYWINSRTGVMFPPVVGGFDGDRGEFYGDDEDDGRPVNVRFAWTKQGPDRAHWEQAFSSDGVNWEVNWTNDFVRVK